MAEIKLSKNPVLVFTTLDDKETLYSLQGVSTQAFAIVKKVNDKYLLSEDEIKELLADFYYQATDGEVLNNEKLEEVFKNYQS